MPNSSGAAGVERVHENQDFHIKRLWIDGVLFDPEVAQGLQSEMDALQSAMDGWAVAKSAELDSQIAAEADLRSAADAALQSSVDAISVPQPASSAPPAIGSPAVGNSALYARQNHNHGPDPQTAINTANISASSAIITSLQSSDVTQNSTLGTHTSQISALQSSVAGISVPAASSTTPLALAATGAVGVATTYARADHAHPGPQVVSFDLTASVAISLPLIAGSVDVNTTVTGLLTTDKLSELQPVGDLPSGLIIGSMRCPSNGTLRIRFTTPVALSLGATNVPLRLTVLR